jgi:hypothetical protein
MSSIASAPLIVLGPLLIRPMMPLPVSDAGQKYCYSIDSYSYDSYSIDSYTGYTV